MEILCSVWLEVQEAKELVNVLGEVEQKTFVLAYLQVSGLKSGRGSSLEVSLCRS